jgi:ribonuclease BN (tRNA processing enzyme)
VDLMVNLPLNDSANVIKGKVVMVEYTGRERLIHVLVGLTIIKGYSEKNTEIKEGQQVWFRIEGNLYSKHQIDFSPDIFYQMHQHGFDCSELEHLLITLTHKDHFDVAEILVKENATLTNDKPIHIYMSPEAVDWGKKLLEISVDDWTGG